MTFKKKHVIIVPYPAFGHLTPLIELGYRLLPRHRVTLLISECKVPSVRKRLCQLNDSKFSIKLVNSKSSIKLIGLMDDLTEEDDKNLTPAKFIRNMQKSEEILKQIYKSMPIGSSDNKRCDWEQSFFSGRFEYPVDTLITDLVMGACAMGCYERGLPFHVFNPSPGIILMKLLEVDENTPELSDQEFARVHDYGSAEGVSASFKENTLAYLKAVSVCQSVLINSVREFEPNTSKTIERHPFVCGKPVRFVAPLFPEVEGELRRSLQKQQTISQLKDWLDRREENTVTYVSFGSMAIPNPDQIKEIAKALMILKRPCVWSLKSSEQQSLPEELLHNIENQFDQDLKYIIVSWAPQKVILKHRATRIFISHCGWNSTMEAIVGGIPVVAWPLFGDQHWDAELLVKEGMGIKIPDTDLMFTRIVPAEEIVQAVLKLGGATGRAMMIEPYRRNAKMARKVADCAVKEGGSSYKGIEELIADIGAHHLQRPHYEHKDGTHVHEDHVRLQQTGQEDGKQPDHIKKHHTEYGNGQNIEHIKMHHNDHEDDKQRNHIRKHHNEHGNGQNIEHIKHDDHEDGKHKVNHHTDHDSGKHVGHIETNHDNRDDGKHADPVKPHHNDQEHENHKDHKRTHRKDHGDGKLKVHIRTHHTSHEDGKRNGHTRMRRHSSDDHEGAKRDGKIRTHNDQKDGERHDRLVRTYHKEQEDGKPEDHSVIKARRIDHGQHDADAKHTQDNVKTSHHETRIRKDAS